MGSGIFFGTMALASAISLVRGFVVAGMLDPAAFGVYVVTVAAGTFGSNVLSLGRVESTWKEYPRLWIAGQPELVRKRAGEVMRILAVRALCVSVVIGIACGALSGAELAAQTVAGVAVALGVACTSVYASVLRASYDLRRLGAATLYRAVLAVVLAAAGARIAGWFGALAGEIVAAAAGVLVSRSLLSAVIAKEAAAPSSVPTQQVDVEGQGGGRWLAIAFVLGAVPFYLDRMFVAAAFSSYEAGTYGFVMLFASGSAAAVGVISQKLGPQLLRQERAGASVYAQAGLALRWAGGFCVVCGVGMALMSWVLLAGPAQALGGRYALAGGLMVTVGLLCCAQVTSMFDWILISRDRERHVFLVSLVFLLGAGCAAVSTAVLQLELLEFIVLILGAKLVSLCLQLLLIASLRTREVGA